MNTLALVNVALALVFSPLLLGVVNRVKAVFAGRHGQPLLQTYYDLGKLLRKGAVYSRTTTWLFRAGPVIVLSATLVTLTLLPLGGVQAPMRFAGDFIMLVALMALARFFMVLAALDTGSSFEGMGASREVQFGVLAEPGLFLGLGVLVAQTGAVSLSAVFCGGESAAGWVQSGPAMLLVGGTFAILFLAENCRIPVDDPNTHLELTMIHEVMALDHGGPDFAFIQYASAVKHWVLGALVINTVLPVHTGHGWIDMLMALAGMFLFATSVGVVESVMARLRLTHVPHMLLAAIGMAVLALVMMLR